MLSKLTFMTHAWLQTTNLGLNYLQNNLLVCIAEITRKLKDLKMFLIVLNTTNNTLGDSNNSSGCSMSIEPVYCGVFEDRPSKYVGMVTSSILVLVNMGLLLGMIWYERYGSDNRRTLMNKLFASICWAAIAQNLYTVLDILRYLLGPRPPSLCFLQIWVKFSITSVFLLLYDAIILTKYILIFWLKNPGAVNDDFWCTFINVWVYVASFLYDGTRLILPGRLSASYYMCTGTSPASDLEMPKRGRAMVEILTVALYFSVMIRMLFHKRGILGVPTRHSAVSRYRIHDLVSLEKSTIATASSNLIILFCFAMYMYFYGLINSYKHREYNEFPNYFIIMFHLLVWTPTIIFVASVLYYLRHDPLRTTLVRELKNYFLTD